MHWCSRVHIGVSLAHWCSRVHTDVSLGYWCSRAHTAGLFSFIGAAGLILLAYLVSMVQQGSY